LTVFEVQAASYLEEYDSIRYEDVHSWGQGANG
jgi:hypothetical protein